MSENSIIYDQLCFEYKKNIQMYLTARQFKNAIFDDEVFIISAKNRVFDISKINFDGLFKPKFKGDKFVIRIMPYIVNKSFACEVYLKLILIIFNVDISDLKAKEKHNLYNLYMKMPEDFKRILFRRYFKASDFEVCEEFLEEEIKKISNAFVGWRYIYETIETGSTINSGFLSWFCDTLDLYSKTLIKNKYKYDVDFDIR